MGSGMEDIAAVFVPNGPLANALGAKYHHRKEQVDMARCVAESIRAGQHAIIEAGTGSGKSFAYLVPLILSNKSALISTANKTLQGQLIDADLPFLHGALRCPFTFALLKGRINYICNLKYSEVLLKPTLTVDLGALQRLGNSLLQDPSGDLERLPEGEKLRQDLTINHEDCLGESCRYYFECYYHQARVKAENSQIVVVNHALLARSIRGQGLGLRDVVVVDEAHELADEVAKALLREVRAGRISKILHTEGVKQAASRDLIESVENQTKELFKQLREELAQSDSVRKELTREDLLTQGRTLAIDLQRTSDALEAKSINFVDGQAEEEARFQLTLQRTKNLADDAKAVFGDEPENYVRYLSWLSSEKQDFSQVAVNLQPVTVSNILHEMLFKNVPSVICTSATLTAAGNFSYFRSEIGLDHSSRANTKIIKSPFDFRQQALLYVPRGLKAPERDSKPKDQLEREEQTYRIALKEEIIRLLKVSNGRALILFTAQNRMHALHDSVHSEIPFTCYVQDNIVSKAELIESFRRDVSSVLFATRSFWTGVDIAGETLSLVIIVGLPFFVPTDPVYKKREELIGDSWRAFKELSVPHATLELKQGTGRLIRNETDRGVVAILDSKLIEKSYGSRIWGSLSFGPPVTDFERVAAFFERIDKEPGSVLEISRAGESEHTPSTPPQASQQTASISPEPEVAFPVLGGYQFIRRIGAGGFGVVYQAEQIALKRRVAIKELLPAKSIDKQVVERFRQEARIAGSLDHPNIVSVFDLIPKGGRLYLVMEYITGGSLREKLDRGPLPPQDVIQIGYQVCQALESVHENGIIHRDIKPENILFDQDGKPRLSDFGIAHVPKDVLGLTHSLTVAGVQPGTIAYMSPEQITGEKVLDGRSDLYTLAVVLYESLTGEFYLDFGQCQTLYQVQKAIVEQLPRPIDSHFSKEYPSLVQAIQKALSKEPNERYESANGMALALTGMSHTDTAAVNQNAPNQRHDEAQNQTDQPSLIQRIWRSWSRTIDTH